MQVLQCQTKLFKISWILSEFKISLYRRSLYERYIMFSHFWAPKLYKSEQEVWDTLGRVSKSGNGLSENIYWAFKGIVDKILSNQGNKKYHPLDFPIVRYFLHPNWAELDLSFVQHPDFIKDMRCLFGDIKTQEFFREIEGEQPDQFYIRIHSLRSVWECAKFLDEQSAKIIEFHCPLKNRSQSKKNQASDIVFRWNNGEWLAEVKQLCHIDINSFCIAQVLAGMMYLETEGENLRLWNNIVVEGENINHTLRLRIIGFIRKELNDIFEELKTATGYIPKVSRKLNELDIEAAQVNNQKIKIEIRHQSNYAKISRITLIFEKWPRPKSIQNYYTISPSQAYFWPRQFSCEFYDKLDKDIEKITQQKKTSTNKYIGFLYLDLHEANIDQRKKKREKQDWEGKIATYLNNEIFSLVLMTDSTRPQKSIYILNKTAIAICFKIPKDNNSG